jgi:hypothetical protein
LYPSLTSSWWTVISIKTIAKLKLLFAFSYIAFRSSKAVKK